MYWTARKTRPAKLLAATAMLAVLTGCATTAEEEIHYINIQPLCESGDTPSCIQKIGKPTRCFCADKEALRELLDPDYSF